MLINVDVKVMSYFSTTSNRPHLGAGVGLYLTLLENLIRRGEKKFSTPPF